MNPLVPDFILEQDAQGNTRGRLQGAALRVSMPGLADRIEQTIEGRLLVADLLRAHFDPLIAAVHAAGGFVAGFGTGDGLTAVFPEAADRDVAAHAIGAAFEMRRARRQRADRPLPRGGAPASMRAGLAWGEVSWEIVRVGPARAYFHFEGPAIEACWGLEQRAGAFEIRLDRAMSARVTPASAAAAVDAMPRAADLEPEPLPAVPRRAPQGDGAAFVSPGIARVPANGDLRVVSTVFLALERTPNPAALIRALHDFSDQFGGTFTGVHTSHEGPFAILQFGAPVPRDTDNERALDFALELKARELGPGFSAGVTRGTRYAGFVGGAERREFACLGRATQLAEQLARKAPRSGILGDEVASRASEGKYQWTTENIFHFDGFDLPVLVFALERRRIAVQQEFHDLGPLGREGDVVRVAGALDPIFEGRSAGIVYVEGDAGIGKSFLLETVRRRHEAGLGDRPLTWLEARCDPMLRVPLDVFRSALDRYFGTGCVIGRADKRARFDRWLDRLLARLPEGRDDVRQALEQARAPLGALLGIGGREAAPSTEEAASAVSAFVAALATLEPVVLDIEDAQWADEASLEVAGRVAEACAGLPFAIVCSSRPRDDGGAVRIPHREGIASQAVELAPLAPDQLLTLATPFFSGPMPTMLESLLCEVTGGSPMFAQELLAYWLEDARHVGSASGAPSTRFMPPGTVSRLLRSRLERLDAGLRHTFNAAVVLGREFHVQVLARMLEDASDIDEHLRLGEMQRLWSPVGEQRFAFDSPLLFTTGYEMQTAERLEELHRLAADAIEQVYGEQLDARIAALRDHHRRVGEARAASR